MLALAPTFITSSVAQCDASWTAFSVYLCRKNKVRTSFFEERFVVRVDAKCPTSQISPSFLVTSLRLGLNFAHAISLNFYV